MPSQRHYNEGKPARACGEPGALVAGAEIDHHRYAMATTRATSAGWNLVEGSDAAAAGALERADPRAPGVTLTDGTLTLPLVVLLGRRCEACDARGEVVCTDCQGTGWRTALFGDDDVSCPERQTCLRCAGTHFIVNGARPVTGPCAHGELVADGEGSGWALERCPVCGLATLTCFPLWTRMWACSGCGLFDCSCID